MEFDTHKKCWTKTNLEENMNIINATTVSLENKLNDVDFQKMLNSLKKIFEEEHFQYELYDALNETNARNKDFVCIANLIENLLSYIAIHSSEKNLHVPSILELLTIVCRLRIKQFITIDAHIFKCLLEILRDNLNTDYFTKILGIALNLSESKFYDKLAFVVTPLQEINELLDNLTLNCANSQLNTIKLIKTNLNGKSIEERLRILQNLENNNYNDLLCDVNFINDLRLLSKELTNNPQLCVSPIFHACDSFRIFTHILNGYFKLIHRKTSQNDMDLDTKTEQIRDLLQIIYKLVQRSMNNSEAFLAQGIFHVFLRLFNNQQALRLLFVESKFMVHKIVRIFYNLSKQFAYSNNSKDFVNETSDVETLKQTCRLFEELTRCQKSNDGIGFFIIFLISLAYLQVKFGPNNSLFESNFFDVIKDVSLVQSFFGEVSDKYFKNSKLVSWEFRNEFGQLERSRVSKIIFFNHNDHQVLTPYYIVDLLNNLKFICNNEQTRQIGFKKYKDFFLSVIHFGADIEKILCLNILREYLSINEIRSELSNDARLVAYLSKLKELNCNYLEDTNAKRLIVMVDQFLSQMQPVVTKK